MPNRILRSGILTSHRVNALSRDAELFYRRLMSAVDDYGRFDATPSMLRSGCFPMMVEEVSQEDVEAWLKECEEAGLVLVYTVKKVRLLEMVDFRNTPRSPSKYQSPRGTMTPDEEHAHFICTSKAKQGGSKGKKSSSSSRKPMEESGLGHTQSKCVADDEQMNGLTVTVTETETETALRAGAPARGGEDPERESEPDFSEAGPMESGLRRLAAAWGQADGEPLVYSAEAAWKRLWDAEEAAGRLPGLLSASADVVWRLRQNRKWPPRDCPGGWSHNGTTLTRVIETWPEVAGACRKERAWCEANSGTGAEVVSDFEKKVLAQVRSGEVSWD